MKNFFFSKEHQNEFIKSSLRVNHAGERAAKFIYQTQVTHSSSDKKRLVLKEMLSQELEHLKYFEWNQPSLAGY